MSNHVNEYAQLVTELVAADHAYWVLNRPTMEDAAYDRKLKRLRELEAAHPEIVSASSPTQRLGGALTEGFSTVKHIEPMLSLDNLFTTEDIAGRLAVWTKQLVDVPEVIVEAKVDGISCDLEYRYGKLAAATTRGNGVEGDDIINNVRTIRSVPLVIDDLSSSASTHVRGEICMMFDDFKLVNARQAELGLEPFKNPRNAAAGAARSLDPKEAADRLLSFVAYHILGFSNSTQEKVHETLDDWGFIRMPWYVVAKSGDELADAVMKFEAIKARMPFPVDGAVIKLNDRRVWSQFPNGTKSVRWGYAYKYEQESAETVVRNITIQVGRTGALAPVAELEPVELDGSTVERATLCNENFIKDKDLRIGDTVKLHKAGAIVPEIYEVVVDKAHAERPVFVFPEVCPECGAATYRKVLADGELSAAIFCISNLNCTAQLRGMLTHWADKEHMDIRGLGDAAAEKLVSKLGVRSLAQLYELTTPELYQAFGPVESVKLMTEIHESRTRGMERVLAGLGVDRLGKSLAKQLARQYPSAHAFLESHTSWNLKNADTKALIDAMPTMLATVSDLADRGVNMQSLTYNPEAAAGKLSGKTVCFTGTLPTLAREQAACMAEEAGAKVTNSVSKKTSYLVCGEDCGSKLEKAKAAGVKILDEAEFLSLLEG